MFKTTQMQMCVSRLMMPVTLGRVTSTKRSHKTENFLRGVYSYKAGEREIDQIVLLQPHASDSRQTR